MKIYQKVSPKKTIILPNQDTTLTITNNKDFKNLLKQLEQRDSTITEIRKELKIPRKAVKTYTVVKQSVKLDTVVITKHDTIRDIRIVSLSNKHINLYVEAKTDSSCIDLDLSNKIHYFEVEKKKLFKTNEYQVYLKNTNPYINNTNVQSFVLKPKTKKITIGPHVGVNIDGSPSVGVSVQYNLIKI